MNELRTGKTIVVWHVTTLKKLNRFAKSGRIEPPVRAWPDIREAERFSVQTGRRIILRLKFPTSKARKLEGHGGKALVVDEPVLVTDI